MNTFSSLGIIQNALAPSSAEVTSVLRQLQNEFEKPDYHKASIIRVMQQILPDFHHIETGKGLDDKM